MFVIRRATLKWLALSLLPFTWGTIATTARADVPCESSNCYITISARLWKRHLNFTHLLTSAQKTNGKVVATTYSSGTTNWNAYVQESGLNMQYDFASKTDWISSDNSHMWGSDGKDRSSSSRSTGYQLIQPGTPTPYDLARSEYYNKWESQTCPNAAGDGCNTYQGETPADQRVARIPVPAGNQSAFGGSEYVCNLDWRRTDDENNRDDENGYYYSSDSFDGYESYTGRWEVMFSPEAKAPRGMIPYLNDVLTITDHPRDGVPTSRIVRIHWPLTGKTGSGPAMNPAVLADKLPSGTCRTFAHNASITYGTPPPPTTTRLYASSDSGEDAPFDYSSITFSPGITDPETGLYFTGVLNLSSATQTLKDRQIWQAWDRYYYTNYLFNSQFSRWLAESAASVSWYNEFLREINSGSTDIQTRCNGYPSLYECMIANISPPDSRERATTVVPKPTPTPQASPSR